jgi:hypothetical protein
LFSILETERLNNSNTILELNNLNYSQQKELLNLVEEKNRLTLSLSKEIEKSNNISAENFKIEQQLNLLNNKVSHLPPNLLTIDVTNKFNDFNIKIFWILNEDDGFGPATIEFKNNEGRTYYVQNNNFSLPIEELPLRIQYDKDSTPKFELTKSRITKSYPEKILTSFQEPTDDDTHKTYFMFLLDINFDGNPELFTMGEREAQRDGVTYKPIFFENGVVEMHDVYNEINGSLYPMTLDFLTEIFSRDKMIKLRHSNGADSSFSELFKWDGYSFKFYKKVTW